MKLTKRVLSLGLAIGMILSMPVGASAKSKQEYTVLQSEDREFGYVVENKSIITLFTNQETLKLEDGAQIKTDINMFTASDDIRIKLNLQEDQYIDYSEEEPSVILIYTKQHEVVGAIVQPYIKDEYGNVVVGYNEIIDTNIIQHKFDETLVGGEMYTNIRITREWQYYFNSISYGPHPDNPSINSFRMVPNHMNMMNDRYMSYPVISMSWSALNTGYNQVLTGADKILWNNIKNQLYNQYECHYWFARGEYDWNIEEYNMGYSYVATVAAGCNPG